jgi:hypothetical protein
LTVVPDPVTPDPAADPPDPNAVTITVPAEPPAPPRQARSGGDVTVFTPEDVERMRQEERARFAAELKRADDLEAELTRYRQSEDERVKAEAKAQKDAERAEKKKREDEMEMRDLLAQKEQEWEQKLADERAEREKALAILDQERKYAGLQNYLAQRMMAEGERIAPQLRRLVAGNSEEEIDASIAQLAAITDEIAGETQQLVSAQNASRRTAGVTSPPIGPADVSATTKSYTADELKDMSMEEYGRREVREQLLAEAGRAYRNR